MRKNNQWAGMINLNEFNIYLVVDVFNPANEDRSIAYFIRVLIYESGHLILRSIFNTEGRYEGLNSTLEKTKELT